MSCGEYGDYICADCVNKLSVIDEPICPMCVRASMFGKTHARCERKLGLDGLAAIFKYRGVMRRIIVKLKYGLVTDMYSTMVELAMSMGDLSMMEKRHCLVVGVPLYVKRSRWRGFNQAEELGKLVAESCGWDFGEEALIRIINTKSQMKLAMKERKKNVLGAFSEGRRIGAVNSRSVLLVDDVWTTGATMRECAKTLKRKGTNEVRGMVFAR